MLETVAGVPGMIGGMARHLKSLRRLSRDHGWIHTLLGKLECLYSIIKNSYNTAAYNHSKLL